MTVREGSRTVRWLVILALSLATAGMFVISMRANYLYGRSIGQSPETQEALAWANVGADIWKAFGLIVVAALWRHRLRLAAVVTAMTWFVCLCFSVSSAIGIYVQERTTLTGGRAATHASYEDAKRQLENIEDQRRGLARHRSVGEAEAAIASVLARPVIVGERVRGTVAALSANCTKEDRRTTEACAEVAELREELAVAKAAATLDESARTLRGQISALRERGASLAPDPVGEFWAWLTLGWVSVRAVGFGLPLFFAFMIEMVSAFGPLGIVAYAEATRRHPTGPVAARRDMTRTDAAERTGFLIDDPHGSVVQFMADRTEPTADPAAITRDELYADYEVWCLSREVRALSSEVFGSEFDRVREVPQLAGKIRKFSNRYYGIRLIALNVARIGLRQTQK